MSVKKRGSVLIFSIIVLMYLSTLTIVLFKSFHNEVLKSNIQFNETDMYTKNNFDEILCEVNNYFSKSSDTIDSLKQKNILINDNISFLYDSSNNKFCISYKYRGVTYKRFIKYRCENDKIIFIPEENKYLS